MFSVRVAPGRVFGVGGCVVVGATGDQIVWVVDAETGRRVAVRSPGSVSSAVAAHRAGPAVSLRSSGSVAPDIPRWAAAIAADCAAGISHGVSASNWESAARAARVLDYSRMDPVHSTEAARMFISAPTVAGLSAHHCCALPVDMRFTDLCI